MIEQDTIRLLRECDAGIEMGTSSIRDVLTRTQAPGLRLALTNCMAAHEKLKYELNDLLSQYHDGGKSPNPIAKGMSWVKTNTRLAADPPDSAIAELMTDGCNMGVKSLGRYLNEYKAADERSKNIAKRLIDLEHQLSVDLRSYL